MAEQHPQCGEGTSAAAMHDLIPPDSSMAELSSPAPSIELQELSPPPPSPAPSIQELSPPAPSIQEQSPSAPSIQEQSPSAPPIAEQSPPAPSIAELSPQAPSIEELSPSTTEPTPAPSSIQEPYPNTSTLQEQSTTGLYTEPLTAQEIQKQSLNNATTTLPALGPQQGVTVKNQAFYVRLTPETKQAAIYPEIELPPGTKQVVIYPKAPLPPTLTSLPLSAQPVTSEPLVTQPVSSLPMTTKPATSIPLGATSVTSLPLAKQTMTLLLGKSVMPVSLIPQPVVTSLPHGGQKVTQLQQQRQPIVLLPVGGTQTMASLQGPQIVRICPKTSLPVGISPQPEMERELRIFPKSKKAIVRGAQQIKVVNFPPKSSTTNQTPSEQMVSTTAQASSPTEVQTMRTFHKTSRGRELRILPGKGVRPPPRQVEICSEPSLQPGQEEIMSESQGMALHAAAWASEVSDKEVPETMVVDRHTSATQGPEQEISDNEGGVHTSGLTGEALILSILTGKDVAQSETKSGDLRSPLQDSSKGDQILNFSREPLYGGKGLSDMSKVIGLLTAVNSTTPWTSSRKLLTKDDLCSLDLSSSNVVNIATTSTDLNTDNTVRIVEPSAGISDKGETTGSNEDKAMIDQISMQKDEQTNPEEQSSEYKDMSEDASDLEHGPSENEDGITPVSAHGNKDPESFKCEEDIAPVFDHEESNPCPDSSSSEIVEDLARPCSQQKGKKAVMLFVCSACDMEFTDSALCKRHIEGHTTQTYDCTQCAEGFNSNAELSQHMLAEHSQIGEIDYTAYTLKPNRQQNNIQVGSVTTTEARVGVATSREPQVATSTTDESVETKTRYRKRPQRIEHRRQRSQDNKDEDDIMKNTQKSEALQPIRKSKTSDGQFKCKLCGKSYKLSIALTVHLHRHANPPPRRTYTCQVCEKVYKTLIGLRGHQSTHTKQYRYQCSLCPLGFASKSKLDRHMNGHEKTRPYKCSVCHKGFTQSADVTRHMRVHTGEKPFQCPRCKKWYRDKGSVTEHLARPYCHLRGPTGPCHVCSKKFSSTQLLKLHLYKVHKEGDLEPTPFMCDICGKGFWSKHNLKSHVARHSREMQSGQRQVFPCEVCLDAFRSKSALTRHIKNFHKETEEPASSDINTGGEPCSAIDSINQ